MLLLFALANFPLAFAQNEPCGFDAALQMMLQQDPGYQNRIESFEENYEQNFEYQGGGDYEIPIVVHIMHNNGPENISDSQVIQAINQANDQFAGLEGGFNTKIKFRLAGIDPNGNCTNGIVRVQTPNPEVNHNDPASDAGLKNLSRWPVDKYLNIWIVRCILPDSDCSNNLRTSGYAYLPPAPADVDGIVIDYRDMGDTEAASGSNLNTLAHEAGHYLSLLHVWGYDTVADLCFYHCHPQSECLTLGDQVCDTNPCEGAIYGGDCEPEYNSCDGCPDWDPSLPYPKENYMSYTFACQDRFTEGQAIRMYFALENYRSSLWSYDNRACTGLFAVSGGQSIYADETWTTSNLYNNGDITITGDLYIEPGATLTVGPNVTVRFCGNGKLVIKPNATLVLHGILTNSCGKPWKGVEVWGDNSQSQYLNGGARAQGRLIGKPGSRIENAETGVQLWGPEFYANAGGQANCTGTDFINNRIAVDFAPYQNFWPFSYPPGEQGKPRNYFGAFSECDFITDGQYSNPDPFYAFIRMERVDGVQISGCTFKNSQNPAGAGSIRDYGYGIFAMDAGFKVSAVCTSSLSPCEEYAISSFTGLGYGIFTANTILSRPFDVQQAAFENCFVGLYDKGVSAGTILFNTFKLGNVPDPALADDQIGLLFESGISGFAFEENKFIYAPGNFSSTIGTLSKTLGRFNNAIRRNLYGSLVYGNVANGQNADFTNPPRGLYYECNTNLGVTDFDFLIADTPAPVDNIRRTQGLENPEDDPITYAAAGNRFSYAPGFTGSDFTNDGGFNIEYYFDPMGANEEPMDISSAVTPIPASENACTINYCAPPCKSPEEIELEKEAYHEKKEEYQTALQEYDDAVSVGDPELAAQKAAEAGYYRLKMDEHAYMVTAHLLYDTLQFDQDSLNAWIGNLDSYEADLWLAGEYLAKGETARAFLVLDNAPSRFSLTEEETDDLNDIRDIFTILAEEAVHELEADAIEDLEAIAETAGIYAPAKAQNILALHGRHYPPVYYLEGEEAGFRSQHSRPETWAPTENRTTLTARPNPAKDFVAFSWQAGSGKAQAALTVVNLAGALVWRSWLSGAQSSAIWDTRDLPSGLYFYRLSPVDGSPESGKIILQK